MLSLFPHPWLSLVCFCTVLFQQPCPVPAGRWHLDGLDPCPCWVTGVLQPNCSGLLFTALSRPWFLRACLDVHGAKGVSSRETLYFACLSGSLLKSQGSQSKYMELSCTSLLKSRSSRLEEYLRLLKVFKFETTAIFLETYFSQNPKTLEDPKIYFLVLSL